MKSFLSILLALWMVTDISGQTHPFRPGESLTYSVYYHLMGIWVGAGEVTFNVKNSSFNGSPCLKFEGVGKTHKRYDWFYKVNDIYEAYADKETLAPLRFRRDVSEGDFYYHEDCIFDHRNSRIISVLKIKEKPMRVDTSTLTDSTFDVLSMIYHARNIDFEEHAAGDKIPIKMFIDRETHPLFIRYKGIEMYKHDELGEIECFVFSPLLVEGTLFKEGERMTVYVTKDQNLVPVYIESEIRVGSIRATLKTAEGLLKPMRN